MAQWFDATQLSARYIEGHTVAILGYGNQGRTHALNLRDKGIKVVVGTREGGRGWIQALEDGFNPGPICDTVPLAAILAMALSDVPMADVYTSEVAPAMQAGQTLVFVHGFNIVYGRIKPPADCDVILASPKGSGHSLRQAHIEGKDLPSLVAVHQDYTGNALKTALGYSAGIGCGQRSLLTSFNEETETDLFGEQVVLCGGIPSLIEAGFNTLVDAGYQPEAAYFECVYEAKLIIDLMMAKGLNGMRKAISDTAEWGGYLTGDLIIDQRAKNSMRTTLARIQDGSFAAQWIREAKDGQALQKYREIAAENRVDPVWAEIGGAKKATKPS